MSEQFVIMTRYQRSPTVVIRHAYGPYPTRAKAQTVLKRMHRNAVELLGYSPDEMAKIEAHVTKLLGDREAE